MDEKQNAIENVTEAMDESSKDDWPVLSSGVV